MFEREKREREDAKTMTVRFTDSEYRTLDKLAKALGVNGRVGVLRRALARFVETDKQARVALKGEE